MPTPLCRGLDFTRLVRQGEAAHAEVEDAVLVLWGATFLRQQRAGLWRCRLDGSRVQVRPTASTSQHYLYDVAALPTGVYLAWTAHADRKSQQAHSLIVESGRAKIAAPEDIIRFWLSASQSNYRMA